MVVFVVTASGTISVNLCAVVLRGGCLNLVEVTSGGYCTLVAPDLLCRRALLFDSGLPFVGLLGRLGLANGSRYSNDLDRRLVSYSRSVSSGPGTGENKVDG